MENHLIGEMTTRLAIEETSQLISIEAANPWNNPGLELVAGASYDFTATGTWKDASIECDAGGYLTPARLRWSEWMRRIPSEPFFKLIGTVGRSKDAYFVIGTGVMRFVPPISGPLFCFANDVRFMYCNNHGEIVLQVTRTG
jgi:hypothetical protein